eukprot:s94_g93.t1
MQRIGRTGHFKSRSGPSSLEVPSSQNDLQSFKKAQMSLKCRKTAAGSTRPTGSMRYGLEEGLQHQVMETYGFLQPFFDKNLHLQPNPRQQKKPRTNTQESAEDATARALAPPLLQLVKTTAQLVFRREHNWNLLQSTDSFVLFFQQEPLGAFPGMAKGSTILAGATSTITIGHDDIPEATSGLLVAAGTCSPNPGSGRQQAGRGATPEMPCSQIDPGGHELSLPQVGCQLNMPANGWEKKPAQMSKMIQHVGELKEDFRDQTLVIRFQGLPTANQSATIPWKLQLNLRTQRPYEFLLALTHSAVWLLLGASLKVHATTPSTLAKNLQHMPYPKGEGKGKTRQPLAPKSEI